MGHVQRTLVTPLPPEPFFKSQVTESIRAEIEESRKVLVRDSASVQHRYEFLKEYGTDDCFPETMQLFAAAKAAESMQQQLLNKFSAKKRAQFVKDHATVRDAERKNLRFLASEELNDYYPLDDVPREDSLAATLDKLMEKLDGRNVGYGFLRSLVLRAPVQERVDAGKDVVRREKLGSHLRGRRDYPKLLVDLQVTDVGSIPHLNGAHTDAIIRTELEKWIPDIVFGGSQKIQGNVAILRPEDWRKTLESYLVGSMPAGFLQAKIKDANAFTAPDGRVYIGADRGNPGTAIHEGIHFYSPDAFLRAYEVPMNEGVTEYFARKIIGAFPKPIQRTQYQKNYEAAVRLATAVGEPVLRDAYFKGVLGPLASVNVKSFGSGLSGDQE